MNYIVTKPLKSKGIAILLVFIFGPLGLFYSTIVGGLIMTFIIPICLFISWLFLMSSKDFASLSYFYFLICYIAYIIICFIWAIDAVSNYNRKLIAGASSFKPSIPIPNINEEITKKKSQLYSDLERVKYLYDQKITSEADYNIQKEALLKKLATLSHNDSLYNNEMNSSTYDKSNYQIAKPNTSSIKWIVALGIIICLLLLYAGYDKGMFNNTFVDAHSKDRTEIKNQIEKTYFGLMNGAYTSNSIQGLGPEGLPFYNQNLTDIMVMGILPMANIFGGNIRIEPSKINVYNFIDANNANVKYDLTLSIRDKEDSNIIKVDMLVKKIGGYWKLDGNKIFGEKKEIKSFRNNKRKKFKKTNNYDTSENPH